MAFEFQTGSFYSPAYQKINQKVIDVLESITPFDIGLSQPYIKIQKINPETGLVIAGPPISNIFQKPSNFGNSIGDRDVQFGESVIHGERPPVSLEKLSIQQKLSFGDITFQQVILDIKIHRPDAIFGSVDDDWASLITPGREHLIEYGWAGSSNNPLLNGDSFEDKNTNVFVSSRKKMLFVTYEYDFSINESGEIKLQIIGYDSASYLLRNVKIGEVPKIKELINATYKPKNKHDTKNLETVPKTEALTKNDLKALTKIIQQKLESMDRNGKVQVVNKNKFISLKTILDYFVAESVGQFHKSWGFNSTELKLGFFNKFAGKTQKKYGGSFPKNIGEFLFEKSELAKILSEYFTKYGGQPTLLTFITNIISYCNTASCWEDLSSDDEQISGKQIPNVKIKVSEKNDRGNKILSIIIFDQHTERKILGIDNDGQPEPGLDPAIQSRENIKSRVVDKGLPYVSLGKKLSFISNVNFQAKADSQLQAIRINRAVNDSASREEYFKRSSEAFKKGLPDPYHEIFASVVNGDITMLGNFAFDSFASIWLDFRVNIWSGVYSIVEKSDEISESGFFTTIKVMSDGSDPLNTRKRRTREQIEAIKAEENKIREEARKKR